MGDRQEWVEGAMQRVILSGRAAELPSVLIHRTGVNAGVGAFYAWRTAWCAGPGENAESWMNADTSARRQDEQRGRRGPMAGLGCSESIFQGFF